MSYNLNHNLLGTPLVTVNKRLETCKTCPNKTITLGVSRCSLCGCIIKFKIQTPNATCPANKW